MLAGTAGGALLAGCSGQSQVPPSLAFDGSDFAEARLSAIMRHGFIPSVNSLVIDQAAGWSESVNATVAFSHRDNWQERYQEAATLRRGEDIAELFGSAPHLFGDSLLDLSDLAEEVGESSGGWMSIARSSAMVNGAWRAIPWAYTAQALNYRPSILDAAGVGVPETWDELLNAATVLREQQLPLAAFSMSGRSPNDSANLAYSLLWAFGGAEVDGASGRVALDSTQTRDALAYFRDLSQVTDPSGREFSETSNDDLFLAGKVSITQNDSSLFWRAGNEAPEIAADMGHSQLPSGPNGSQHLLEVNALAVFEHSRNKAAAIDLIRHLVLPEQLRERTKLAAAFFIPPLVDYRDDEGMPWNTVPALAPWRDNGFSGRLPGWPGQAGQEASLVFRNGSIVNMFASAARGDRTLDSTVRIATQELQRVYET